MPQAPNIDGLPTWLQICITLLFGAATLLLAIKGYRLSGGKLDPGQSAAILGAQIADMGAVRHLADVCIKLIGAIEVLDRTISDQVHWDRQQIELMREECQRLRELRESMDRLRDSTEQIVVRRSRSGI
mgnify:CR=1 FL=1